MALVNDADSLCRKPLLFFPLIYLINALRTFIFLVSFKSLWLKLCCVDGETAVKLLTCISECSWCKKINDNDVELFNEVSDWR